MKTKNGAVPHLPNTPSWHGHEYLYLFPVRLNILVSTSSVYMNDGGTVVQFPA